LSTRHHARLRSRAAVFCASIAAVAGVQLAGASVAAADQCDNNLNGSAYRFLAIDSGNFGWDFTSQGDVYDGNDRDAYDDYGLVTVDGATYDSAGQTTCALEADGRQFDLGETDMSGLKVSRKVYAPATGTPFGRMVTFLRNPSAAPITVNLTFEGNLGSDSDTTILATSSGDNTLAEPNNDVWAVSADSTTAPSDPPLAHVWDSAFTTGVLDRADHIYGTSTGTTPWANGQDYVRALYDNVIVPAGATIAYMQIEAQRNSIADAQAAAPALAAQPLEVFADLNDTELNELQNWNGADIDGDGVANTADNCRSAANANQADLDKDGLGDACDSDIDGDGTSNGDEAIRGTDPLKPDTDGDGVTDKADACPTVAGKGANGCPRFDDATPPGLALSAKSKLKRKAALKGVKVTATTNEASTVLFELFASAKNAHIAKSYNLVLATKTAKGVNGKKSVTLKPKKSLVGSAKKFTLRVRVTATDAFGNRTVKTKTITVKG